MNNVYTYTLILAVSLVGPLALSFDRKVAFYKQWKPLFMAMVIPAIFYIVWDMIFTSMGVWEFSPQHILGFHLINLPVEEVMFFWVVPYCCIFIYACIEAYFPQQKNKPVHKKILQAIALILLLIGSYNYDRLYTFWTFIFNAIFILLLLPKSFHAARFLLAYGITLIPFLVVNGFLTAIPVVIYNDSENLGLRISTIPVEDVFYGMLLVMMNLVLFDRFRNIGKHMP